MTRLKSKLLGLNANKAVPTKIFSPANCEELRIPFRTDKVAKVVGRLASIPPPLPNKKVEVENGDTTAPVDPQIISGVLVQNENQLLLMAPEDLKEYAGLTTTTIVCRQHLTLSAAGVDLIRWALEGTFGAISESTITDEAIDGKQEVNGNGIHKHEESEEEVERTSKAFKVMDCVNVNVRQGGRIEVEWEGNMMNDGIADAVLAVLFTVESSPAAVRRELSLVLLFVHPTRSKSSLALTTRLHRRRQKPFGSKARLSSSSPFPSFYNQRIMTNIPPSESSRSHSHSHTPESENHHDTLSHRFKPPTANPHKSQDPSVRLQRLFMFLESQFGETAVAPIPYPRNSTSLLPMSATPPAKSSTDGPYSVAASPYFGGEGVELSVDDKVELKRLHNLGIPVPGVEIRFDKYVARVWLEDLDVECASAALKMRIKAVVERGVETVSGLWA